MEPLNKRSVCERQWDVKNVYSTLPIVFHTSHVCPLLLGHYKSEHTHTHTASRHLRTDGSLGAEVCLHSDNRWGIYFHSLVLIRDTTRIN